MSTTGPASTFPEYCSRGDAPPYSARAFLTSIKRVLHKQSTPGMTRIIVDCHVNLWDPHDVRPLFSEGTAYSRPGSVSPIADPDTAHAAMVRVDKAIVFSLRYADSAGIDGDDEVTARAVRKYPDKFVGFAAVDPRRSDCMELLRTAVEEFGLKGVKFGP